MENISGFPLARARVRIARLEGNRLVPVAAAIASRTGQFVFPSLDEGYYMLNAVRASYADTAYGQRRNNGPGTPIFIAREGSVFVELRLKRLAAITGRTLDENRVGLAGITVVAYTSAVPMRLAGSATSDDRGVYRIIGLAPGRYIVRTGPAILDDGLSLLPAYYPVTGVRLSDARPVSADLDADSTDVDIQPAPGRLASLTVTVSSCHLPSPVTVTLSTDTGRKAATMSCKDNSFGFSGLAPGDYELLAEGEIAERNKGAVYQLFQLDQDREIGLALQPLAALTTRIDGAIDLRQANVIARRHDLAGEGPERSITSPTMELSPGDWQITARPPSSHYLADIRVDGLYRRGQRETHPDWFDFTMGNSGRARATVTLSAQPAQLSGRVTIGGKPAIGAPVYLWPATPQTRRRLNGFRTSQASADGGYRFDGLPPGAYLVLSSLDVAEITEQTMSSPQARSITIEEGRTSALDLDLSQLP